MITLDQIQSLNFNHVIERGTPEDAANAVEYLRFFGWVCVGGVTSTISPFPDASGNYAQSYTVLMENPEAYETLELYLEQEAG